MGDDEDKFILLGTAKVGRMTWDVPDVWGGVYVRFEGEELGRPVPRQNIAQLPAPRGGWAK